MQRKGRDCNFRFTKSKERGEKSKWRRVKGRERDMQRSGG
jgi:hypothetical protein